MTPAASLHPRTARWLLALVLAGGLVLRIGYAVHDPGRGRFYDERYGLENIHSFLVHGNLERFNYPSPVFNLPPAMLVAASNAVYRWTGDERFLALDDSGRFHPAAYLVCRLLMVVYGMLAVVLVYLVGRRVFSPAAGLLAAAMMAFMPWQIHASGNFKPDPLLVLTVVAALWASLRAVDGGRLGDALLSGVAIALAMSAKLSGGLAALPLMAATAVAWRERRRWLLLAAAGATSALTFVLLNPYWTNYRHAFDGLMDDWARRAVLQGMTRAQVPERLFELLVGGYGHGPILGVAALAGFAALVVRALRPATPRAERVPLLMLVVFPLAFVAAYAYQTAYFKPNNLLPIFAFTSLAAAWLLTSLWRQASARLPLLAAPPARWLAAGALALALVPAGVLYVHRSLTPSTADLVMQQLRRRLGSAGVWTVAAEEITRPGPRWAGQKALGHRFAVLRVERLSELEPRELDLMDAEIFREERLRGPDAEFYRARMARLRPRGVRHFRPELFETGGPALVALLHKHVPAGKTTLELEPCDAAPTCFDARLPDDLEPGERLSVELYLPARAVPLAEPLPPIRLGDRPLELIQSSRRRGGRRALSERWIVDDPRSGSLRFEAGGGSVRGASVVLHRWAESRTLRRRN